MANMILSEEVYLKESYDSEPSTTIGDTVSECQESWEKRKKDLLRSMDAGKNLKEKVMLDGLRDAIQGSYTQEEIDDIKARLAESEKYGFEEPISE